MSQNQDTGGTSPHITTLRAELLATLRDLRNRADPMDPDRARAIAQVASVMVDSAKVEVEFIKVTGQESSAFIGDMSSPPPPAITHASNDTASAHNPFRVTRHRLQG